jgi:glycosyltransferase involved in cell wall biosynthesis
MTKAILIPVYLRLKNSKELPGSEGVQLTKRAIQSLKVLRDEDFTLVLLVCFDLPEGEKENSLSEMDKAFREEIRAFGMKRAFLLSSRNLEGLRTHLDHRNFEALSSLIDLKGFSKIRNTGLLLAQALSIEAVLFMDNDEVIEDPDFLKIACEHLHEEWDGKVVSGKGGFYVNRDGKILIPSQHLWWRALWNKTKWMNQVWEKILSSRDRLVSSPLLLGGNLILHSSLFQSIPFDPFIPRGEDTDYLINAHRWGFSLFFDPKLRIRHLHPERTTTFYNEELRGDIERFLYEREKVKEGFDLDLDPYPGYFLKRTLPLKAFLTSFFLSLDHLARGDWKAAGKSLENLSLLFQTKEGGWGKYSAFKAGWEKVMGHLQKEGLNEILGDCRI